MKAAGRTLSVTELIDGFEHVTADRWSNMPVMVRLSDGQDYSVSGVVSGDGGSVVLEVGAQSDAQALAILRAFVEDLSEARIMGQPTALAQRAMNVLDEAGY